MKHPIFFLFFVLVTTAVINAIPHTLILRQQPTEFSSCAIFGLDVPDISVTISPDSIVAGQNVTFHIIGTTKFSIPAATVGIFIYNDTYDKEYQASFCDYYISCPLGENNAFGINVTITPEVVPESYNMDVWIYNDTANFSCATTYTDPELSNGRLSIQ
ncbi:5740_t:CDS:1 [Paraglomus occultum]|uniref:Phosphatidylglycerol/phosphatidylinositol transfer protein n=1 Tax=Paraglomus occultum TaxID=144539 RepID=A0A9N8ZNV5_9GLOM|nr:5740_t:CDS:1 [Paraglomus occultum]